MNIIDRNECMTVNWKRRKDCSRNNISFYNNICCQMVVRWPQPVDPNLCNIQDNVESPYKQNEYLIKIRITSLNKMMYIVLPLVKWVLCLLLAGTRSLHRVSVIWINKSSNVKKIFEKNIRARHVWMFVYFCSWCGYNCHS